jgi:hypothetical protein
MPNSKPRSLFVKETQNLKQVFRRTQLVKTAINLTVALTDL